MRRRAAELAPTVTDASRKKAKATAINPLKESDVLQRGMQLAAAKLQGQPCSAVEWCRLVYEQLGYADLPSTTQALAYACTTRTPRGRLFAACGLSAPEFIKKPTDAIPELPPIPGPAPTKFSVPSATDLLSKLSQCNISQLMERGVLRIPSLLTPQQACETLQALSDPKALTKKKTKKDPKSGSIKAYWTKEQILRESTRLRLRRQLCDHRQGAACTEGGHHRTPNLAEAVTDGRTVRFIVPAAMVWGCELGAPGPGRVCVAGRAAAEPADRV